MNIGQDSGSRVVFGRNKQRRPPPIRSVATMNVGAGQYMSSSVAITILPIIPPRRAATMEMATPVALKIDFTSHIKVAKLMKDVVTLEHVKTGISIFVRNAILKCWLFKFSYKTADCCGDVWGYLER